jgi:hypothetical protein
MELEDVLISVQTVGDLLCGGKGEVIMSWLKTILPNKFHYNEQLSI